MGYVYVLFKYFKYMYCNILVWLKFFRTDVLDKTADGCFTQTTLDFRWLDHNKVQSVMAGDLKELKKKVEAMDDEDDLQAMVGHRLWSVTWFKLSKSHSLSNIV